MNSSRPTATNGQPITLVIEGHDHVQMLGGSLTPRLTIQQKLIIESKMHLAQREGVPLVVVLWPQPPAQIVTDTASKLVQQ